MPRTAQTPNRLRAFSASRGDRRDRTGPVPSEDRARHGTWRLTPNRQPRLGPMAGSRLRGLSCTAFLIAANIVSGPAVRAGDVDAARAQTHYRIYCQGCHLPDGSGTPGSVPALAGSLGSYLDVEGGRAYIGRVPGATSSPLSDAELAEVYNWLLATVARDSAPPDFEPFTADEMGAYRQKPLLEIKRIRAGLVARMKDKALPIDDTY